MNKKKSVVDHMLSFLEQTSSSSLEEDDSNKEKSSKSVQLFNKNKSSERSIVLVKREKNFHRRIFNVLPQLGKNHIDMFFGFMGINERAIENPGYEESYLYSFLQVRTIEKIEIFEKAIILEMTEPECQYEPPVQYLIEKYRSKGRMDYYEMSLIIQELIELLKSMGPPALQTPQIVKKYLDELGDNMYLAMFGPRKVVLSKSLLTYLDYDIEELTVQATKYRSLLIEITSSLNYAMGIKTFLKFFKYTAQLNKGLITPEEYKELTTYHFCDYIHSKYNVSSFCEMRFYQLTPNYIVQQIDKILYKEERDRSHLRSEALQNAIEGEKERIKQSEYKTLKKLKRLPRDLLVQNKTRIAGYIQRQPESPTINKQHKNSFQTQK